MIMNHVAILKFFFHISKDGQKKRLQGRLKRDYQTGSGLVA